MRHKSFCSTHRKETSTALELFQAAKEDALRYWQASGMPRLFDVLCVVRVSLECFYSGDSSPICFPTLYSSGWGHIYRTARVFEV